MKLTGTGVLGLVALAALGIIAWRFAPDLKKLVTKTLNPANPQNIVNRNVTAAVSAATGREETLGGWLAEWFDPTTRLAREMLGQKPGLVIQGIGGPVVIGTIEKPAGPAKRVIVPSEPEPEFEPGLRDIMLN